MRPPVSSCSRIREADDWQRDPPGRMSSCSGILRRYPEQLQGGKLQQLQILKGRPGNMTEKGYRQRIIAACKSVGTYRKEFDWLVDMLAEMYVRKQEVKKQFEESGQGIVIEQVNKSGNKYTTKNPYLMEIDNCNKIILDYERELGLTPAAIKKINESAIKSAEGEQDPLANALNRLHLV